MGFLTTIIEYEGPVANTRPRWWAAHQAAAKAVGLEGPTSDEFWRLIRTGVPDGTIMRAARPAQLIEYTRIRNAQLESNELMALDEPQPALKPNLQLLKQMGTCHLVSLCRNREGINTALNRFDIWMYLDKKSMLPEDRSRRVPSLKEMVPGHGSTLAVVGTVAVAYVATEAGCRCVGLNDGPNYPKFLRQVGVDAFFDSLDELTDALARRAPELERLGLHF